MPATTIQDDLPLPRIPTHNGVSELNEWVQQQHGAPDAGQKLFTWDFEQSRGLAEGAAPEQRAGPCFRAVLSMPSRKFSCTGGWRSSKKMAQHDTAYMALEQLKDLEDEELTPLQEQTLLAPTPPASSCPSHATAEEPPQMSADAEDFHPPVPADPKPWPSDGEHWPAGTPWDYSSSSWFGQPQYAENSTWQWMARPPGDPQPFEWNMDGSAVPETYGGFGGDMFGQYPDSDEPWQHPAAW